MNNVLNKFLKHVNFDELYKTYQMLPTKAQQHQFLVKLFINDEILGQVYTSYKASPTVENKQYLQKEFNQFYIFFEAYELVNDKLSTIHIKNSKQIGL